MIELTTCDGREITINAELVEMIESVPETLVTLNNGKRLLVKETRAEVKELILEYRRAVRRLPVLRK